MAIPKETTWEIDPHTKVKHEILKRYLQAWFAILGKDHPQIVYIDGFCGPGRYNREELGSPIVVLNAAISHKYLKDNKIKFWFIDDRQDRIEHLTQEVNNILIPNNFEVIIECGKFHEKIEGYLNLIDTSRYSLPPTFVFIDPFGFSGIPFSIIKRLLQLDKCEIFINFPVVPINRFLEHPGTSITRHIEEAFGTEKCVEIARIPGDRIKNLRKLYQQRLGLVARFVRSFEMRDRKDCTIYYLFFASNHELGHSKMKAEMWKMASGGEFVFSDATNPEQLVLIEEDPTLDVLRKELQKEFKNKGIVIGKEVRKFVENKTEYIGKHLTAALRALENSGDLRVERLKSNGKKRKAGSFPPEVQITFL